MARKGKVLAKVNKIIDHQQRCKRVKNGTNGGVGDEKMTVRGEKAGLYTLARRSPDTKQFKVDLNNNSLAAATRRRAWRTWMKFTCSVLVHVLYLFSPRNVPLLPFFSTTHLQFLVCLGMVSSSSDGIRPESVGGIDLKVLGSKSRSRIQIWICE